MGHILTYNNTFSSAYLRTFKYCITNDYQRFVGDLRKQEGRFKLYFALDEDAMNEDSGHPDLCQAKDATDGIWVIVVVKLMEVV